jgi:hypothetical protein
MREESKSRSRSRDHDRGRVTTLKVMNVGAPIGPPEVQGMMKPFGELVDVKEIPEESVQTFEIELKMNSCPPQQLQAYFERHYKHRGWSIALESSHRPPPPQPAQPAPYFNSHMGEQRRNQNQMYMPNMSYQMQPKPPGAMVGNLPMPNYAQMGLNHSRMPPQMKNVMAMQPALTPSTNPMGTSLTMVPMPNRAHPQMHVPMAPPAPKVP